MEGYSRAYRDRHSPLTPLTPLTSSVFNFNIDEQPSTSQLILPSTSRRCSTRRDNSVGLNSVNDLCQIFGQGLCSTLVRLTTPRSCESALKKRRTNMAAAAGFPINNSGGNRCNGSSTSSHRLAMPSQCNRRSVKRETSTQLPNITIQPPPPQPRRKRFANAASSQQSMKHEMESYNSYYDAEDDSENETMLQTASETFNSWEAGLTPTTSSLIRSRSTANSRSYSQQQQQQQQRQRQSCGGQATHFNASNVRMTSPVPPKPMSPRFGEFLTRWGINCLQSIFERQEIDMQTFCCLSADDLELLGIQEPENRQRTLQAINFLAGYLSKKRNPYECDD